jgi:carbohydrate-selective porin OprB
VRLDRDILTLPKSEPPRRLLDGRWASATYPRKRRRRRRSSSDGRLAYGEEKIFEAYYSYKLNRWSALTFDYQFIADPAYNADVGRF